MVGLSTIHFRCILKWLFLKPRYMFKRLKVPRIKNVENVKEFWFKKWAQRGHWKQSRRGARWQMWIWILKRTCPIKSQLDIVTTARYFMWGPILLSLPSLPSFLLSSPLFTLHLPPLLLSSLYLPSFSLLLSSPYASLPSFFYSLYPPSLPSSILSTLAPFLLLFSLPSFPSFFFSSLYPLSLPSSSLLSTLFPYLLLLFSLPSLPSFFFSSLYPSLPSLFSSLYPSLPPSLLLFDLRN